MKHFIFLILLISLPVIGFGQVTDCVTDRYQQRVFNNIQVRNNITYGAAPNITGFTQSLEMDVYEPDPSEEYLTKRPLVLMMFGGGYLLGGKNDPDMEAWCDSLAHYGYVCVSIEYRLDNAAHFALFNQGVRAAYRAVQDAHAAVRYILEDPNNENFNIDTDYIYAGGQSAGAITAIHLAYMEESERPSETFNVGLFDPDMGCISCSGNNFNQSFDIRGVVDIWGAVLDLSYLDTSDNIPMVLIHGDQDFVIPFNSGSPFNVPLFPTMHGAVPMAAELASKNIVHEFYPYPGEGHVFYGTTSVVITFPNQLWDPVFTQGHEFLYNRTLAFNSPIPTGPTNLCPGDIVTYQVPANSNALYCWTANGGTVISSTPNTATVQWNTFPAQISVTETSCIDVSGAPGVLNVNSSPSSYTLANGNRLSGIQLPPVDYETDGDIESDQVLQLDPANPGVTNIDYDSRTRICLLNGFEAIATVDFHAFIDGCGNQ